MIIKFSSLIYPYFIWSSIRLFYYFIKCISNTNPFLSFNGTTDVYLLNKSIAHKRYLITLFFFLLNNRVSAKSTPHTLSLNCEYTFRLLNFLITGLCNSSAKILLTSFVSLPEIVLLRGATFELKNLYTILAKPL